MRPAQHNDSREHTILLIANTGNRNSRLVVPCEHYCEAHRWQFAFTSIMIVEIIVVEEKTNITQIAPVLPLLVASSSSG